MEQIITKLTLEMKYSILMMEVYASDTNDPYYMYYLGQYNLANSLLSYVLGDI
jgi:hypothetical protein